MATSTTTLLTLANKVADVIAEKRFSSVITSPTRTASRVRDNIDSAVRELESEHRWSWLYKRANAASWSTDVATITDLKILLQVVHGNDTLGYRAIPVLPRKEYRIQTSSSYDVDANYPQYYVQLEDNQFAFNPYPADATRQNLLTFEYIKLTTLPTTDNGTFEIPERYMELLLYKTSALSALNIMLRPDLATAWDQRYFKLLGDRKRTETYPNQLMNWYGTNAQKTLVAPYDY